MSTETIHVEYGGADYSLNFVAGKPGGMRRKIFGPTASYWRVVPTASPRWCAVVAKARRAGLFPQENPYVD